MSPDSVPGSAPQVNAEIVTRPTGFLGRLFRVPETREPVEPGASYPIYARIVPVGVVGDFTTAPYIMVSEDGQEVVACNVNSFTGNVVGKSEKVPPGWYPIRELDIEGGRWGLGRRRSVIVHDPEQ